MNRLVKITIISFGVAVLIAAPSFATDKCIQSAIDGEPTLSETGGEGTDYPVKCSYIEDGNGEKVAIYGKTSADCARVGTIESSKCIAASEEGISSSDDSEQTDIAPAPTTGTTGEENPVAESSLPGTTPQPVEIKKQPTRDEILLNVSLIANGVLFLVVIILIILLSKKKNALAAAEAIIASTQVVPPHNTQTPYTPEQH